jgi:hypothetical protein
VSEKHAELLAHQALGDAVVAIAIRAEGCLRVVDMEAADSVEADPFVDLVEEPIELIVIGDVVAGCVEVAGIEAEAEAWMSPEPVDDRRELVDGASDRSARAGRVLDEKVRLAGAPLERGLERCRHAIESAALQPGAEMGSDMEDDAVRSDGTRRLGCGQERRRALLVEIPFLTREVDEVERVDEDATHLDLGPAGATRGENGRVVVGEAPRAGALDEELDGVRADLDRSVDGSFDAASAVGTEQHVAA